MGVQLERIHAPVPHARSPRGAQLLVLLRHWRRARRLASSEHDLGPGSAQHAWLRDDLARAHRNRASVPWIVFALHRPLYSSDAGEFANHSPGAPRLRDLEPMLLNFSVDLTVSGHQHGYERCHPARNGSVLSRPVRDATGVDVYTAPAGPVHLMIGTAGALQAETWVDPQPAWSAH